jgi:hypothetical protein
MIDNHSITIDIDLLISDMKTIGFEGMEIPRLTVNGSKTFMFFSLPPNIESLNIVIIYYLSAIKYICSKHNITPVLLLTQAFMHYKVDDLSINASCEWVKRYEALFKKLFDCHYSFTDTYLLHFDLISFSKMLNHLNKKDSVKFINILEMYLFYLITNRDETKGHYIIIGGIDQKKIWDQATSKLTRNNNTETLYAYHPITTHNNKKLSIYSDYWPKANDIQLVFKNKMKSCPVNLSDHTNLWTYLVKIIFFINDKLHINGVEINDLDELYSHIATVNGDFITDELIDSGYHLLKRFSA